MGLSRTSWLVLSVALISIILFVADAGGRRATWGVLACASALTAFLSIRKDAGRGDGDATGTPT